jgi:hypothetical protein
MLAGSKEKLPSVDREIMTIMESPTQDFLLILLRKLSPPNTPPLHELLTQKSPMKARFDLKSPR